MLLTLFGQLTIGGELALGDRHQTSNSTGPHCPCAAHPWCHLEKKKVDFFWFLLDSDLIRRAVWRQEWSWKVCKCSCRSDAVGHCTKKQVSKYFCQSTNFLLLYVKSGAGLLALHCGDGHPSSGVIVDHPLVLVPEHVLGGQEGVLEDADKRYESALLYPVLVRWEDNCFRSDHVEVNAPRLHFSIGQGHLYRSQMWTDAFRSSSRIHAYWKCTLKKLISKITF